MYFTSKNSALAAILSLVATGVNAHMLLAEPKPFTTPSLQNGPIDTASGRAFPCQVKAGEGYAGTATKMALGSSQDLAFTGGATHGGGSCQISITYDESPTKDSVFKVIHSIEGGCVANVAGNIGDSATAASPYTFQFPIPSDIPTGKATLAWSWINRIGNREFYMNCAPVELTGTSGSQSAYDALPDMLVTNIDGKESCNTVEGNDYMYPNPGMSVQKLGDASRLLQLTCDAGTPGGAAGSSGGGGGGSQAPSKPATSAPVASPTKAPTSAPVASPTKAPGGIPGGVFAPAPSSATSAPAKSTPTPSAAPKPSATSAPAASKPSSAAPSATAPSTGSGSGSGSGAVGAQAAGSACQPEGLWNCVGGNSYQLCGSGTWSVVMSLAAGTSCTPGQSSSLSVAAVGRRRAVAFRA